MWVNSALSFKGNPTEMERDHQCSLSYIVYAVRGMDTQIAIKCNG